MEFGTVVAPVTSSTRMLTNDVRRDLNRLRLLAMSARDELLRLRDAAAPAGEQAIRDAVGHWLYETWYSVPHVAPLPLPSRHLHTNLPAAFRAALPSSTRWLTGWVAMACGESGACVAGRRGHARELRCGQYANVSRPGAPVVPGDGIAVMECVDWVDPQTGFWTTRSSIGDPVAPLVRLYWSVAEEYIGIILRDVTTLFEHLEVRYSLKCPIRSADFARVDPLVVYLERSALKGAEPAIAELARRSQPRLRESSPPLTLDIARGVAFAEDPGANESFGQSRCRVLVSGVLALLSMDSPSDDDGIEILAQSLRDTGVDPARPWLNAVR